MKTAELTGALLDYWVAKAEGVPMVKWNGRMVCNTFDDKHLSDARPYSTEWAQGGPLIDKYRMYVDGGNPHGPGWSAATGPSNMAEHAHGVTPLEAICRAVVRSVYGDEVPE